MLKNQNTNTFVAGSQASKFINFNDSVCAALRAYHCYPRESTKQITRCAVYLLQCGATERAICLVGVSTAAVTQYARYIAEGRRSLPLAHVNEPQRDII